MSPESEGKRRAASARQEMKLGLAPVADMAALLEEIVGADVIILNMPEHYDGFTRRNPATGDIVVAAAATASFERQRFTLAHELGHILAEDLLNSAASVHEPGSHETRAHAFARHFLAPLEGVKRLAARWAGEELTSEVVRHFKVSPYVARIQLGKIGVGEGLGEPGEGRSAGWLATRYGWDSERNSEAEASKRVRPPRAIVSAATAAYEQGIVDEMMLARIRKGGFKLTDEALRSYGIGVREPIAEERAFDLGDDW